MLALNARTLGDTGWDAWSVEQAPHPALGPLGTDLHPWRGGFFENSPKHPFTRVAGKWVPTQ